MNYLSEDVAKIKSLYSSLGYNFVEIETKIRKIDEKIKKTKSEIRNLDDDNYLEQPFHQQIDQDLHPYQSLQKKLSFRLKSYQG